MSVGYKALEYMIGEKVRQIEIYRKHMASDDLSDTEKDSYRTIIENLEKDIEKHKEEYRAEEKLKYSKDDVSLSPDGVSKEIDMSDESETYRDDVGGMPESSLLAEDRADEPERFILGDHDAYSVRSDYKELFGMDEIYENTLLSDWDDMSEVMIEMGEAEIEEEQHDYS